MTVRIVEHLIAGVGRRYDIVLQSSRELSVLLYDDGGAELLVRRHDLGRASEIRVALDPLETTALVAVLSGADFAHGVTTTDQREQLQVGQVSAAGLSARETRRERVTRPTARWPPARRT